ncbi:MAG: type II secretion system GspH family protein [Puniceicoccales bacterium]|nr:type II secretion system GspH family protein [Puniceicoccales bacterium]
MKHTTSLKQNRAFTLVELLAVITILGILMTVMATQVPGALKTARMNASAQNLRSIVVAYTSVFEKPITEGGDPEKGQANDIAGVAEVLARYAELNKGDVWFIGSDTLSGEVPEKVLLQGANQVRGVKPQAWDAVINPSRKNFRDSSYPLMWTRGLSLEGKWDPSTSPWGERGGHIAFGDGHVDLRLNLKLKPLSKLEDGTDTASYQDAIGTNARVVKGD